MPSIRNNIKNNVNGSKNTRMNLNNAVEKANFRKDELMHIGRYIGACQTAIDLSAKLGRPVRVLDLGCGEMYFLRMLYASFVCKKSDVVKQYIGIDIDDICLGQLKERFSSIIENCNAKLICQDITTNPHIKVRDGYFDMIIWYEMIEHVQPEFIPPMMKEVSRVLNPDHGIALISTPNANGSNKKLPKDHIYEWAYEELMEVLKDNFASIDTYGMCINSSRVPAEVMEEHREEIDTFYNAWGRNSAFACVAAAALIPPTYCKNVLYKCKH